MTSPDPRDTPTYLAIELMEWADATTYDADGGITIKFWADGPDFRSLQHTWRPDIDLNQTALCEARMTELGLQKAYIDAIYQEWKDSAGAWSYEDNWYYLTLSASQRCEAMRKVLEVRSDG